MDDPVQEQLIEAYLQDVEASLRDLPAMQRREIVEDLRAHIADAMAATGQPNEAALRTILDRLGEPAELARAARERLGVPAPAAPVEVVVVSRPGALEIAAIVVTALFFPVGLILAAISEQWRTRDKLIAALIPAVAFGLPTVVGFAVRFGAGMDPLTALPFADRFPRLFVSVMLPLMFSSPLLAAAYLAVRLRSGGRRPAPRAITV